MRSLKARALRVSKRKASGAAVVRLEALEGDALAISTLQAVCRSAEAPASARAQAARTLLEASGALRGKDTQAVVPGAEMTGPELDAALVSLAGEETRDTVPSPRAGART